MPSFMAKKRSKFITVTVAGTLTVATVVTAVAATIPTATAAAQSSASNAFLTSVDAQKAAANAARANTVSSAQEKLQQQQARANFIKAEKRAYAEAAAKAAAARKAAAAKAAAAHRAAAARAAAAAAAKRAAQQRAARQHAIRSGSPTQIAQAMLGQYGWSASQYSCLYPLWEHESGWNPAASNPSSGAFGIPQALPGSQMASAGSDWQTNPATQIKWGLSYIQSRYGSPCGAWAHEQSSGWY
jgi:hypothetical protein